jgi:hypothetical protein
MVPHFCVSTLFPLLDGAVRVDPPQRFISVASLALMLVPSWGTAKSLGTSASKLNVGRSYNHVF